jgi:hypothetical protein
MFADTTATTLALPNQQQRIQKEVHMFHLFRLRKFSKGEPMFGLRNGAIAVAVALAVVSPATASAAEKGTERPVKGYISGENAVTRTSLTTFSLNAHASGVLSHLGENVTADFTGSGFLTGIGTPNVGTEHHGNVVVTADNGNTLIGDFTVRGPAPAFAPHEIQVEIVITGGTGRFEDASGRLESVQRERPLSFDGVTLRQTNEGAVTGQISY